MIHVIDVLKHHIIKILYKNLYKYFLDAILFTKLAPYHGMLALSLALEDSTIGKKSSGYLKHPRCDVAPQPWLCHDDLKRS